MASNSQISDNPSLVLVTTMLDGSNYLSWSRSMLLAINAKHKTDFILRNIKPVDLETDEYRRWKETNDLVFSWILNALSKELGSTFMHASTSKDRWDSLRKRCSQSNGPLIFQLRRETIGLTQGNMSLVELSNRNKRKWDEYALVRPVVTCNCVDSIKKAQTQVDEEQQLCSFSLVYTIKLSSLFLTDFVFNA
ncbi:hypothetical protein M5689_006867 [Euphorbia peplus]|nr:hypothetical protein M5689_006867 [Euphorbia peplus]